MVQTTEELISTDAQRYLLIYMIAVLIILTALIIVFFIVFQKRKNKLLFEKIMQQKAFDEEMQKAHIEIQEQTLKHIGRELHDNIGQILAYAIMQTNMLSTKVPEKNKGAVNVVFDLIKQGLDEVRTLSKSLNNEVLMNLGFKEAVDNEVKRLRRMNIESVNLEISGEEKPLKNNKHQIILFRILQEFFSNTIKYSEADTIEILLNYTTDYLIIKVSDNGKGFDVKTVKKGAGLINMKSRADLIDAEFQLISEPNKGTSLILKYHLS